ncbi:hypothetical protein MP228_009638 [Amoeboaphelidium protococcarum]|nr:hypothetical protein MP228_009638 [Amoeboaphelidium protococcarum]
MNNTEISNGSGGTLNASSAGSIALVTVDLYDDSNFKTSLQQFTTPRSLLKIAARKRGLTQIECFGFQVSRSMMISGNGSGSGGNSNLPRSNTGSGSGKDGSSKQQQQHQQQQQDLDEKVFLLDDVAIAEQIIIQPKFKIQMAMKYAYTDLKTDFTDEKSIAILYGEMSMKFRAASNPEKCQDSEAMNLVAIQVHCKNAINPSISQVDDAREMLPAWMDDAGVGDDKLDKIVNQVKAMANVSFNDAAKKFLIAVRSSFPSWFISKFEAIHADQAFLLNITAATEGLYIQNTDKNQQTLYLSYKSFSRWAYVSEDDSTMAVSAIPGTMRSGSSAKRGTVMNQIADDQMSRMSDESTMSSAKPPGSGLKNFFGDDGPQQKGGSSASGHEHGSGTLKERKSPGKNTLRFSMNKKNAPNMKGINSDIMGFMTKDKPYRYVLTLSFNEDYIYPLEFIVISQFSNDYRLKELIEHYSGKSTKTNIDEDDEQQQQQVLNDDPTKSPLPVTCVALCDHEAKEDDELMFLVGDVITVTKKLENGFYIGTCQSVEGRFAGSMVKFEKKDKEKKLRSALFAQIVKPKAKVVNQEIATVYFLGDNRKSMKITEKTTGQQLIRLMGEKMDIGDCDFFGIAIQTESGERWMKPHIPVVNQGVTGARLQFKVRSMYYDVSDLQDKNMSSMHYQQVKQFVLSGVDHLEDNEVIEFASFQLQVSYGDHDPEKHKASTIGAIQTYLPPTHHKFTMTKSENWWYKKILSAHQQHKGLTAMEAEKAYYQLAQKMPHFGYTIFGSLAPENVLYGIHKDYIAVFDKNTKNIVEKFSANQESLSYSNSSLVVELKSNVDSVVKKYTFFSVVAPEFLELLNLHTTADIRNQMRRKCRQLKEKFNLFGIAVELDGDVADRYLKDPEYLARFLRNGVAFKILVDAIDKPLPQSGPFIQPTTIIGGDSASSELPTYSCMEKIQDFLNYARDTVGVPDSDLFLPEELYTYSISNFQTVLNSLDSFFDAPALKQKINQIQEYLKVNKIKAKVGGQQNSAAMTQEDFMRKVMDELLMTETNYSKDLQYIVQTWSAPLNEMYKSLDGGKAKDAAQKLVEMFGNVDELNQFHLPIVEELKEVGTSIEKVGKVGEVFASRSAQFVKLYEIYCSNHMEPAERIPDLSSHPEIASILSMNCDGQEYQLALKNLSSQLIKPVQRIMRYHLLLKELVRYTLESHPGYKALDEGLNKMKEVASAVNEIKRRKENERTVVELQQKIEGFEGPSITEFGHLIQDGRMMMIDKSALNAKSKISAIAKDNTLNFFLFEDVLLICKENAKKKGATSAAGYKFKAAVPLTMITVRDSVSDIGNSDEYKFCWELFRIDVQKTLIVSSSSYEEKERWISLINENTEKSAQKPHSIADKFDVKKLNKEASVTSVDSSASRKTTSSGFNFTMRNKKKNAKETLEEVNESSAQLPVTTHTSDSKLASSQNHLSATAEAPEISQAVGGSHSVQKSDEQMGQLLKKIDALQSQVSSQQSEIERLSNELREQQNATKILVAKFNGLAMSADIKIGAAQLQSVTAKTAATSASMANLSSAGADKFKKQKMSMKSLNTLTDAVTGAPDNNPDESSRKEQQQQQAQ